MERKVNRKSILTAISLATVFAAAGQALADELATWTINGQTASGAGAAGLAPAASAANLTVGNLTLGSGVLASGTASTFGGSAWDEQTTEAGAIANGDFLSFSFTAAAGATESFSTIGAYNVRRSGTGPSTGIWQYQIGSGAFVDIGSAISWGTVTTSTGNPQSAIDLTGLSALQNVGPGVTVTFRLVNWGDTGTGGTWYLNGQATNHNLFINGTVGIASSGGTPALVIWSGGNGAWDQTNAWTNLTANDTTWSNAVNGPATTAAFNAASTVTIASGGSTANGLNFQTGSNGVIINGSANPADTLTLSAPGISVAAGATATINAPISGIAGINIQGSGTVALTNTSNSFTGGVTLTGGKLSITDDRQLGDAGNAITLAGGSLQTTVNLSTGRTVTGGGGFDIAPGTTLTSTGNFNATAVTLSNSGTLDLNGSNTTVGNITVTGAATLTSSSGQQIIGGTSVTATNLNGTATIASTGGILLATGVVTVDVGASGNLVIPSTIHLDGSGSNSLKKTGAGTLELDADNSGTMWRVQIGSGATTGGLVKIGNAGALGNQQLFFNYGALQATTDMTTATGNPILNGISIGGTDAAPITFAAGGSMEFQGATTLYESTGVQNHMTVNNTTTFSGSFADEESTTYIASGLTINGSGTMILTGDASLMHRPITVAGTATFAVNTSVNGGLGTGVTVNSGAKLTGNGTINGAVAIAAGGTLAPGSSTTTLTINGTLTLGGTHEVVGDATAAGLNAATKIVGVTTLTYGGNLKFDPGAGTFAVGQSWDLFDFTTETGLFANNNVFNTNGSSSGGFFPTLPSGVWVFDYTTGILSIQTAGSGTPSLVTWSGGNGTWGQASAWTNTLANDTTWNNAVNGPATIAAFTTGSTITVAAGGTAADGLSFQAGSNGVIINGADTLTFNSSSIALDPSVTATINAPIAGASGINISGGGTLLLGAANTFTGGVTINSSTLSISSDQNLGDPSNSVTLTTGTLKTTASITTARSVSGTGTIDIAPSTTLASTGAFSTTTLTLSNNGTLDLQGATPSIGALTLTGAATVTSTNGQQIAATGITATNLNGTATISSTGGINLGTGSKTVSVGATGNLVIAAPITLAGSGTNSLRKTGDGTLELDGNNSNMWRVQIGSASVTTPTAGGIVKINNNNALGANQLFLNDGTLQATADLTGANALAIGISLGGLDNGPAVLAGSNMEFQGATGFFQQSSAAAQNHLTVSNTTILGGAVTSGTGLSTGLTLDGGGKLVINGDASGMTLATAVNAGTSLILNNTWAAPITLNKGTLGGAGASTAIVTAGSDLHTIHPSAGLAATATSTLTLAGLTTNANTTLKFNLGAGVNAQSATSTSDLINITGSSALTLNGGSLDVSNHATGNASVGYFKIMQYAGDISGAGISSILIPANANTAATGVRYFLDTIHDPGFVDVHRGYMGDADDSGFVDLTDLTTLAGNWQHSGGWNQGDFDGSGFVDLTDLTILAGHWQTGIGSFGAAAESLNPDNASWQAAVQSVVFGASVPEPTSLALLGLGAAGLITRRRRSAR